jgi:hypothetical protein
VTSHRAGLLAVAAFAVIAAGGFSTTGRSGLIGAPMAEAQNLGQRVVTGKVIDSSDAAVSGAVVFLKDLKTKNIRSYTTQSDGKFRFTGVNMAEDHDLWAEKEGKKSATKSVSSWDARTQFECELKLK